MLRALVLVSIRSGSIAALAMNWPGSVVHLGFGASIALTSPRHV